MKLTINNVDFNEVESFCINNVELSIVFDDCHHYSSIKEIRNMLAEAGLSIGNYYFKGYNRYGKQDKSPLGRCRTDIVCTILNDLEVQVKW